MRKDFSHRGLGAIVLLLVAAFLSGAGCLSETTAQDTENGSLHAHYQYADSWSPGLGCYSHVTGYVYNAGNASAETVDIYLNLVNLKTSSIRDSRSIYIGTLAPGATQAFETTLDGDCTQDYRVQVIL